ncbi:uncharacterized protein LOC111613571 isoform X2 [Centruroides sculpturatus]|uniref:uncharacterized protein LOC111613571 isoform X2 n=1 Tax=Centruroides sculpturatus TaxID=218467 RepID=UPI000C6D4496|nr:uncharacterized protein LOC111613571 isoform X2 [Centruroides sculpturatus]
MTLKIVLLIFTVIAGITEGIPRLEDASYTGTGSKLTSSSVMDDPSGMGNIGFSNIGLRGNRFLNKKMRRNRFSNTGLSNVGVMGASGYPIMAIPGTSGYPNMAIPSASAYPNMAIPGTSGYPNMAIPSASGYPNMAIPSASGYPNMAIPSASGYPNMAVMGADTSPMRMNGMGMESKTIVQERTPEMTKTTVISEAPGYVRQDTYVQMHG